MLLLKYLNSFIIYNFFLIIFFSLSVTSISSFLFINSLSYVFLHYLLIYLGLYYFRKSLYIIYFLCGLGIDLLLINQIGPHLLVFMLLLIFFNMTQKFFKELNSLKISIIIFMTQITIIFCEMLATHFLFNYNFNTLYFFQLILISLISSYPILLLFNKVDNFKNV